MLSEVNTERMNIFLQNFQKHIDEKNILLIMDNIGCYVSLKLKVTSNIELMYLPYYSNELNPVKRL